MKNCPYKAIMLYYMFRFLTSKKTLTYTHLINDASSTNSNVSYISPFLFDIVEKIHLFPNASNQLLLSFSLLN